jgi:murein DD-endopeptidase MepM/ murein hydrolase activator NlpD
MRALALVALVACAGTGDKMAWTWDQELAASEAQPCDAGWRAAAIETIEPPGRGGPLESEPPDVAAVRALPVVPAGLPAQLTFAWPLPATGINSLFGKRRDPMDGSERWHWGVDLAAEYGQAVSATAPGFIVYAGWNGGHGRTVIIEHDGGWRSTYSHLAQALLPEGSWVNAGQAVGLAGNSGRSTGPHLHFELTRYGEWLDPLELLGTSVPVD